MFPARTLGTPEMKLIEAAKTGNTIEINSALKQRANVNAAEPDGTTALQWAVHRNQTKAVELLIRAGAKVKSSNLFGVTPLSEAAANGNAAILEILLRAGADANATSVQGEPALMTAARSGNADAVRVLLKHGAAVDARESWKGQTALMWAAAENHFEVAKALIAAGADLNARSTEWPLEAQRPSNGNIVSVRPRGGLTPILFAAREGALDSVRILAQAGADLNLTEPDGTNALVMALVIAHYDVAALLMEEVADPKIADKYGRTALYAAIDMNSLEASMTRPAPHEFDTTRPLDVAKAALSHGADVDARLLEPTPGRGLSDEPDAILQAGTTPFLRAAKTADLAAMQLLLDHGANPLLVTKDGTTALMAAAGLGWNYGYSQVSESAKRSRRFSFVSQRAWTSTQRMRKAKPHCTVLRCEERPESFSFSPTAAPAWTRRTRKAELRSKSRKAITCREPSAIPTQPLCCAN